MAAMTQRCTLRTLIHMSMSQFHMTMILTMGIRLKAMTIRRNQMAIRPMAMEI